MAFFYEENPRLLTPEAFEFVLDSELKRAVRSQNYVTLLTIAASGTLEDATLGEVAGLIGREVRDTDLIGHTDPGTLAVVLLDADADSSERVINRLLSRMEDHRFSAPLQIKVGAASYPTHAVNADSLRREALARPVVTWTPRPPASPDHN